MVLLQKTTKILPQQIKYPIEIKRSNPRIVFETDQQGSKFPNASRTTELASCEIHTFGLTSLYNNWILKYDFNLVRAQCNMSFSFRYRPKNPRQKKRRINKVINNSSLARRLKKNTIDRHLGSRWINYLITSANEIQGIFLDFRVKTPQCLGQLTLIVL